MKNFEIFREYKRMCESFSGCRECPLGDTRFCTNTIPDNEECRNVVKKIEQWVKEHPEKTRQTVFLENYPNALLDDEGYLDICPQEIEKDMPCPYKLTTDTFYGCDECHRKYWGEVNA